MALYEKRTYQIATGKMAQVVNLYEEIGWPALESEGFSAYLVGYFISDTGRLHQLIHIWRFDDDNDRRDYWRRRRANEKVMNFVDRVRAFIEGQEVQLMFNAPWGPKP